jgi:hypothetical protein
MDKVIFNTAGDGFWSNVINAEVEITDMCIAYIDSDFDLGPDFGELRVYFNTDTWDLEQHGLIYTDSLFIKQLRKFLHQHGLPGHDVDYSEQGMQGDDYVSLDVGEEFLEAWGKKFNINWTVWALKQMQAFESMWK